MDWGELLSQCKNGSLLGNHLKTSVLIIMGKTICESWLCKWAHTSYLFKIYVFSSKVYFSITDFHVDNDECCHRDPKIRTEYKTNTGYQSESENPSFMKNWPFSLPLWSLWGFQNALHLVTGDLSITVLKCPYSFNPQGSLMDLHCIPVSPPLNWFKASHFICSGIFQGLA